jgi:hypothetical protein
MVCTNCCKKLDSIHRFACMAVKMQDKLKMLLETPSTEEVKKEHSILHSILSKVHSLNYGSMCLYILVPCKVTCVICV